jgi:tetratricopeptide (TPR) repeat protein
VAAYPVTITSRFCCAVVCVLALSCTNKRQGPEPPSDPAELFKFVSKIRHSDAPLALKLAASGHGSKKAAAVGWRFRLLHAELLLDRAGGGDKEAVAAVLQLLSSPVPPDVPPHEAAARIASVSGYVEQKKSRWDEAKVLYDRAYGGISFLNDDPCWKAELLVHHQAQTLRHQDKWDDATGFLKQATSEIEACPDKYWEALASVVEGNLYQDHSYYENAIASFQKGIDLAAANKLTAMIPIPMGNVGLCYFNLGDYDRALSTFDKTEDDDDGWVKGHRARTYLALKQYEDAGRGYREAIQIAAKMNSPQYLTRWRAELTSLYIETRDYKSAERLNQQVLKEASMNDFPVLEAARLNEARLARLQGNFQTAQDKLDSLQLEVDENAKRQKPELIWQLHSERAHRTSAA